MLTRGEEWSSLNFKEPKDPSSSASLLSSSTRLGRERHFMKAATAVRRVGRRLRRARGCADRGRQRSRRGFSEAPPHRSQRNVWETGSWEEDSFKVQRKSTNHVLFRTRTFQLRNGQTHR